MPTALVVELPDLAPVRVAPCAGNLPAGRAVQRV